MKFKAHIKLTQEQKDLFEWRLNDEQWQSPEYKDIEFTFQDFLLADKYDVWLRKVLFPWLLAGNQPEVVELDDDNERKLFTRIGRQLVDAGGDIRNFPGGLVKKVLKAKDLDLEVMKDRCHCEEDEKIKELLNAVMAKFTYEFREQYEKERVNRENAQRILIKIEEHEKAR